MQYDGWTPLWLPKVETISIGNHGQPRLGKVSKSDLPRGGYRNKSWRRCGCLGSWLTRISNPLRDSNDLNAGLASVSDSLTAQRARPCSDALLYQGANLGWFSHMCLVRSRRASDYTRRKFSKGNRDGDNLHCRKCSEKTATSAPRQVLWSSTTERQRLASTGRLKWLVRSWIL
jgi:hypothetical protein